ncbi:adenylate/guanylate cyclase [Limnospira maxima CS-328]|uniref:Adenylate/guanylate cyclase n=1 Tax=Limnospira maxima CS-328 TaxID=513049 RepID=B5VW81_LIMMA|nr:response regulator [Limnospira maxima]EDZ96442.1 adenylate/guanylate cyclase [Limnospira maxima CS-328]MDC0839219.1 response regulator [Limnoraphis robusta]
MSETKLHILWVDDEPANLVLLEDLLMAEGYDTTLAESGPRAIELATNNPPDLVLLDIMMPDMNGFEVCDRLREHDILQTTPIIFLTALDDEESRLKGLEKMGDDYITKPINIKLLLAKIHNIIKLHKMRNDTAKVKLQRQVQEQNQRQFSAAWQINENLSNKFQLFVPQQFLKRIAPQGVGSIQLGNVTEEHLTVLFCDIRGFTSIAESQQARETFEWLNAFFNQMSHCISSHNGFIDKYLGDAIMAVFDMTNSHAIDALNSALLMQDSLRKFNRDRHLFSIKDPIRIGIGIDTGIGMIGTLGSNSRMDSTVIGNVVNTASRLEGLTKIYGCQIIASKSAIDTAELMTQSPENNESFQTRWIDCVTPRGKKEPLEIYEVLASQTYAVSPQKILTRPVFDRGTRCWRNGNIQEALKCFQAILTQDPSDTVAQYYLEKCQ